MSFEHRMSSAERNRLVLHGRKRSDAASEATEHRPASRSGTPEVAGEVKNRRANDSVSTGDSRRRLTPQERQRKAEIFKTARPAENVKRGDTIKGKVYNVTDEGAFILTDEKYIGLIHKDEQAQPLKIGMTVEGRVTFVRPDGRINLSLRPQKEYARLVDAEKIMEYIKKRNGSMPFNDSSPPEIIKERFGISKAAFKRALGKLFKDGLVEERDGWIVTKDNEESPE